MQSELPKGNFNKVLKMVSLNNFALAFVSVFIPIYLLKLGYSFQMIMIWMIIQHIILLITSFIVAIISNRIGVVHVLHIRFALLLSYFSLLVFVLPKHPEIFYFIPVLIGMEMAFYWMPLETLLVRNTEEKGMGSSMSKYFVLPDVLAMFSPLLGAVIAIHFGFIALFSFAMLLLSLTFLPIISLRKEGSNFIFSFKNIAEALKSYRKYFIPEVISNLMEDTAVVWSIFIYLKLASTLEVGIVSTITGIVAMIFTLTIGKITDNWDKHKLLKIGAILVTLAWVVNFAVGTWNPTKWAFYGAAVLMTFCLRTFKVPLKTMIFNKVRTGDSTLVVLRELPVVLGRVILYGSAILLYNHLPILFLFVGVVFIYFWFLNTRKLA